MPQRILIVDDEPNIVLSLEFLMKRAGYAVRTAGDGETALRALEEEPADLVLLDLNLPGKSGYEVCQEVRAHPGWEGVRVLMLTALGGELEQEKGLAMGADGYVTKPFSTRDLVERVARTLAEPGPRPGSGASSE